MASVKNCLGEYQDEYSGERIFIIGNGPSLAQTTLEKLNPEYTLGMNRINKIYPDTDWRPSLYYFPQSINNNSAPDTFSNDNCLGENIQLGIPCFINSTYSNIISNEENVFFFDKFHLWGHNPFHNSSIHRIKQMPLNQLLEFWSDDISQHIYHYHAMYGAIQTAVFLGFKKIYLIGCDLGLPYINPHMVFESGLDPYRYDSSKISYIKEAIQKGLLGRSIGNAITMKIIELIENSKISIGNFLNNDQYHFTSTYLNKLMISDGPKNEYEMRKSHIVSKRICNSKNIGVYNATAGGSLDIYERVDLDSVIS